MGGGGGVKDENIFDIQQGVSINIFIKTGNKIADELARVFHYDLYGERKEKYRFLLEKDINSVEWKEIQPQGPYYFFVPKDFSDKAEYERGFGIAELFPVNSVGIVTARDDFTIHETEKVLKDTISAFLAMDDETARIRFNLGNDVRDWSVSGARKDLVPQVEKNPASDFSNIVKINYRPFDIRYTYYTGRSKGFHCMPREKVMRHFLTGENVGLTAHKREELDIPFAHIFVTNTPAEHGLTSSKTTNYVFPLYLYPDKNAMDKTEPRRPNLNADIVNRIAENTGLRFTEEKEKKPKTFAPLDVLDYIYGVLHSAAYREKYKVFLKIDFPRVPYPAKSALFQKLKDFGAQLRSLHLMEDLSLPEDLAMFPGAGSNEIEKPTFTAGRVYINKTQYFDPVPLQVWEYYIGGYQPAQKWLKDRKGRSLSFDDMQHYKKIIVILAKTIEIQQRIDAAVSAETVGVR
jgi:predicted helicase